MCRVRNRSFKPWMIDLADDHFALDIGQARRMLGWEPKRSLRDTLLRMVSALKSNPIVFYKKNQLELPSWQGAQGRPAEAAPSSGKPSEGAREKPAHAHPSEMHHEEHGPADHVEMVPEVRGKWALDERRRPRTSRTRSASWFISRYLAAVQLGYIPVAWEPFFGEGSS